MSRAETNAEAFVFDLFYRKDSRKAASALMVELQAKGGRCTVKEMSEFAKKLQKGELGFKYSRVNFYKMVLGTFLREEFMERLAYYDDKTRRTVKGYKAIAQPIPTRRPSPSFWSIAYDTCKWWNDLMFPRDDAS